MQQLIQFVITHWALWLALVVVIVLIIRTELQTQIRGVHLLTPQEVVFQLNQQNALLIDLRDPTLFEKSHLLNAISAPHLHSENGLNVLKDNKARPLILMASHDNQALRCGVWLRAKGFEQVGLLKGGMHAWLAAELPVATGSKKK